MSVRSLWHETKNPLRDVAILFSMLLIVGVLQNVGGRGAFVSSEVRFADSSSSGLSIVPASCASRPPDDDYPGQCSILPCTLKSSKNTVNEGDLFNLHWEVERSRAGFNADHRFSGTIKGGGSNLNVSDKGGIRLRGDETVTAPNVPSRQTKTYSLKGISDYSVGNIIGKQPRDVACNVSVTIVNEKPNQKPNGPTINGSGKCTTGQPYSIRLMATDSDIPPDLVNFEINWGGGATEFVPAENVHVRSGVSVDASHTYGLNGARTISVRAWDNGDPPLSSSGWVTHKVTCEPAPNSCAIEAADSVVVYGGSTKLTFSSTGDPTDATINHDVGVVSSSGSHKVSNLTSTRTYTMKVQGIPQCETQTIKVCAQGQVIKNGQCTNPTTYSCSVPAPKKATICTGDLTGLNENNKPHTSTLVARSTNCSAPKCQYYCPAGTEKKGYECVSTTCDPDFGDPCSSAANSCGQRNTGVYRCDGTCSATRPSDALCVPSPQIVTWSVRPVLVQRNNPVQVTWRATSVASCTVTGTNNDGKVNSATGPWSCSGNACSSEITKTSSGIVAQTVFTISCRGLGLSPETVTDSTTVNIVPVFCETGTPGCD